MGKWRDKMLQIDAKKFILERANQGMTMSELAEKAGVSRKTIYCIENEIGNVRDSTLGKVSKALGKPLEEFIKKE
jgi:transcriptional regulator with XRE-family HTH domain